MSLFTQRRSGLGIRFLRLAAAAIAVCVACSIFATTGAFAGFGASLDVTATNSDGTPDVQAGSYPYEFTTTIAYNRTTDAFGHELPAGGEPKDIVFDLPPGLLANPQAVPRCSMRDFNTPGFGYGPPCPADTQVGLLYIEGVSGSVNTTGFPFALDNLTPPAGSAVAFGFRVGDPNLAFTAALRTGGDYGATVSQLNISQVLALLKARVVVWGVPGDPRHDALRWDRGPEVGGAYGAGEFGASFTGRVLPFLRLPTQCEAAGEGFTSVLRTDSWAEPGKFFTTSSTSHLNAPDQGVSQGMLGCGTLDFKPTISVQPGVGSAGSPLGYNVDIHVPQSDSPTGLAEADLRKAVVTLPAGVSISPSTADGLGACTATQIGLRDSSEPACPDNSKIGDVEVTTPLLEHALTGGVYIAQPYENPFGSLFALYVTAQEKESGVLVKLAGRVTPDPVTGQLTVTFDNNPPLPFSDFKMKMLGGPRASLSNPPTCGTYTTTSLLSPWSGEVPVAPSDSFQVLTGAGGGACMNPLPFSPGFSAGTVNPQAGEFTPFVMRVTREDGEQTLAGKFQVQTPPGMLGMLKDVTLCKEPAASQGTCGAESEIGHVTVGTGPGSDPYYVHGTIYLTEAYKGAPFGLSIVVPAVAGPFNLGNVVVRAAIDIDPSDSHLYVTTEPIPTILDGIPIQVRSITADVDRSGFIFNPTDCSQLAVKGIVASVEGVVASVQSRFQAGYCSLLGFHPKFSVTTNGHTSKAAGASLDAKLTFPAGHEANIAKVKVELPKQLPSKLTTLQQACPDATFRADPAVCPPASRIGYAKVSTPVLSDPLSGPVFFVSHGGAAFPDLVIVLQGDGVRVDVIGATNISKAGITSTSFNAVQDVPISSFELYLPQGPNSALTANGNLCKRRLAMPTFFTAQDGAVLNQSTPIVATGCKAKASGARKARAASRHRKRGRATHNRDAGHGNGRKGI